jgi:hypothetical protein
MPLGRRRGVQEPLPTCEDDYYAQEDPAWGEAYEILRDRCEGPPSFEQFEHGLEMTRARARAAISVQQYAYRLGAYYQRRQED